MNPGHVWYTWCRCQCSDIANTKEFNTKNNSSEIRTHQVIKFICLLCNQLTKNLNKQKSTVCPESYAVTTDILIDTPTPWKKLLERDGGIFIKQMNWPLAWPCMRHAPALKLYSSRIVADSPELNHVGIRLTFLLPTLSPEFFMF